MSTFVLHRFRSWQVEANISIMEAKRKAKRVKLGPTGDTVRANLAEVRLEQRLTLRDLSEMTARFGRPMSNSTISQIENGSRRVDVDDLMALAGALGVSPNRLLMPAAQTGDELVASTTRPEISARELWFFLEGMRPLHVENLSRTMALDCALRSQPPFLPLHTSISRRSANDAALMIHRRVQSDGLSVELEVGVGSESIFAFGSGSIPDIDSNS